MGKDPRFYREELAERVVTLPAFEMDATEITNAQFKQFVTATGYVTDAEKPQAGFNVPGGAVFKTPTPTSPQWWDFVEGANWRHPEGPESTIIDRDNDPVVQVTYADAQAYASWAERRLPTEDEWEAIAQSGDDAHNDPTAANAWQGAFPIQNSGEDGFISRAPVGCYQPNAFGAYDMVGNVWEWTSTPQNPDKSQYVIKGGSFLCAQNYCRRDRPGSRQFQDLDFPTSHIGFRTVKDIETSSK